VSSLMASSRTQDTESITSKSGNMEYAFFISSN